MKSISIIGTGNVGYHLAKAFHLSGIKIQEIYGRDISEAEQIASMVGANAIDNLADLKAVDILIIAVSDDAIKTVASSLPEHIKDHTIVAHTSGTKPLKTLKGCNNKAIFYPLQTFSKEVELSYENIPFCLNGKRRIIDALSEISSQISNKTLILSDEKRREVHLSAVILNNFTNHLIYLAKDRLKLYEIDESILDPLLNETVRKQSILTPYDAQTGPARRDDQKTIKKHLNLLDGNRELYEIYMLLSDNITNTYQ